MCAMFGVDSSSHFSFTVQTDTQDKFADHPTHGSGTVRLRNHKNNHDDSNDIQFAILSEGHSVTKRMTLNQLTKLVNLPLHCTVQHH